MGKRVYLGLGSNLGNKERIVRKAIDKVGERVGAVVAVSSFYKTAPWGYQSVHTFCNAAIAVDTDLSPEEVLFTVQEIERELGSKKHRERDGSYVDRLIDIDLLDYDGLVLDTRSLVLPHPYMHKRTFVMTPLAEIAPQWVHPVLGKTVTELLKGLQNEKGFSPQSFIYMIRSGKGLQHRVTLRLSVHLYSMYIVFRQNCK